MRPKDGVGVGEGVGVGVGNGGLDEWWRIEWR